MKKIKDININMSGITLIALVITIIVMLILAGVSLNVLVGDNGVLTQAQEAKIAYEEAEEKEKVDMAITGSQMNEDAEIDYETLNNNIKNEFGPEASVSKMENESTGLIDYVITLPNGKTYSTASNLKVLDIFIEESKPLNSDGIGVAGYMIELNQKVGLRYYFTMPGEIRNTGAKIKFLNNGEVIKEIPVENAYSAIIDGNSYYYVTAYCAAKEMSRDITFCMYDKNGEELSDPYTYSIKAYGNAVIEESKSHSGVQGQITEKEQQKVEYIKALLWYGGMSQIYFANLNKDNTIAANLASEGIEVDTSYVTLEKIPIYDTGLIGDSTTNYFYAPATDLGDEIKLKVILKPDLTEAQIAEERIVGGITSGEDKLYTLGEAFDRNTGKYVYCVDIPVKITEFDKNYEIYLVDVDNNIVGKGVRYGLYTYLRNMLERQLSPDDADYTNSELFKDVARAMFHLSECGKEIF